MAEEEKQDLTKHLETLGELLAHIEDFLRRHTGNANQTNEDEIEIDIDSLGDDNLFQLRMLLDDHLQEKQSGQQAKTEPCEMEVEVDFSNYKVFTPCMYLTLDKFFWQVLNESGLCNSSRHPCKG